MPIALHPPSSRPRVPTAVAGDAGQGALDAGRWLVAVAALCAVSGLVVALASPLGTAAAPFAGHLRLIVGPRSLAAPAVAAVVLAATAARRHERLGWRALLAVSWLAATLWTLALAVVGGGSGISAPLARPDSFWPDVVAIGDHPGTFLRHFVAAVDQHTAATRQHPPGPPLLLWALRRAGLDHPGAVGLVVVAVGALAVPLVAIAVRSLCHDLAARRLLPVLVLAPYALWAGVSMDAVACTLAAAALACGAVGSERGRSPWWAAAAGLFIGLASLFSYAAPWLGVSLIAVYFARRRPLLNVISGLTALAPLLLAMVAGFSWEAGLHAASHDMRVRAGRPWWPWALLDVAVLVIGAGPALAASLRKIRRTPGWPFLAGAGLAVISGVASGLARGTAERDWVLVFPWLLVAAVAPERRPAPGAPPQAESGPTPWIAAALGALTAVVLAALLRSPW